MKHDRVANRPDKDEAGLLHPLLEERVKYTEREGLAKRQAVTGQFSSFISPVKASPPLMEEWNLVSHGISSQLHFLSALRDRKDLFAGRDAAYKLYSPLVTLWQCPAIRWILGALEEFFLDFRMDRSTAIRFKRKNISSHQTCRKRSA